MIRLLDHTHLQTAEQILTVQLPSYEVEAELIQSTEIPRLYDTAEDILLSGETFLGYYEGSELAGFLSYKEQEGVIDIHRLAVAPAFFKKGIAKALLTHLFSFSPQSILVNTAAKNKPAVELYLSSGFKITRTRKAAPGLWLTEFKYKKRV
ncbi:GNAT family N-acetyltransferase [Halobacillus sp. A5]|uniref:GNAT family N-acetyltransferase n=1 Tax=Halobacillus sp. A5 TaxID=2880263 RepID=UPI0020A6D3A8|nr:GNAT family N-acetyltransferase [Halobacillus sp. A5]MCP3029340.1 GNAT family N-acetyltransferase [Halobacillus sp. A5]